MSSPDDVRDSANPPPRHFSAQHLSGRGGAPTPDHTHAQPPTPRQATESASANGSPSGQFSTPLPPRTNGWIPAPANPAPAGAASLAGRTAPAPAAPVMQPDTPQLAPEPGGTPPAPPVPAQPESPAAAPGDPGGFRLRRPNLGAVAPPTPPTPDAAPQIPVPAQSPPPPPQGAPITHEPPTPPIPPQTGPSQLPRTSEHEPPSAQDTSARLRAVNPDGTRRTPPRPESAPRHASPSSQPAQPPRPVAYTAPAPTEGVTQFAEPGRGHLTPGGEFNAQATPAHLDPRVAGLTTTPQRRGRVSQFFHRAPDDVTADNPTSGALTARIDLPRRISVVGLKGGVGKTTLSILLAKTAARERRQPVMILDSDTTYGSLALRTGVVPIASAHDIARMGDPGSRQVFATSVSRTEEDVWVLPTGRSPEQSANFTDRTYVEAMRAVYRHFPIIVTDCGAGMAGPLMQRVISASHALVIATSPSMDGILASHNALQWLASLGYTDLLQRTIVAMSNVATPPQVDLAATRERFAQLCRGLVTIPTDPHLSPGSQLSYDALSERTRKAARDLTSVSIEAALSAG